MTRLGFSTVRDISQLAPRVVLEVLNLDMKRELSWTFGGCGARDKGMELQNIVKVPNINIINRTLMSWTRAKPAIHLIIACEVLGFEEGLFETGSSGVVAAG